jgi:WD40 repeat protein
VNNDQVAIGFENGEIQVASLLTGERSQLTPDKDDRVFALVFSRDARTLYSAHGSGLILPWDVSHLNRAKIAAETAYDTQFAIQTMTLVGDQDRYLAVGGRYNRFVLLDLDTPAAKEKKPFLNLPYPSGSSTDYITSLSVAEQKPNLLAVSDSQGQMSLWNLEDCLAKNGRCGAIDKSWLGHGGSPVRAVALSASGCFLASAADDGQVKLWSLDGQGMRRSSALEGRVLSRLNQPLNTVDILETRREVWVTSGGEDGQVRVYRVQFEGADRQDDRCPVFAGGG